MDCSSQHSVSRWILEAKRGNREAWEELWNRYFHQLVRLARRRLGSSSRREADEEDVALSALAAFSRAAEEGRFPDLADRGDLWRLLVSITAQKVVDQQRRQRRRKRGGGRVRGESVFALERTSEAEVDLDVVIGDTPTPEFAVMVAEQLACLLDQLDEHLRPVAVAKMEGCTNAEIAARLDCSVSTIQRSLRLIRKIWEPALSGD